HEEDVDRRAVLTFVGELLQLTRAGGHHSELQRLGTRAEVVRDGLHARPRRGIAGFELHDEPTHAFDVARGVAEELIELLPVPLAFDCLPFAGVLHSRNPPPSLTPIVETKGSLDI